MLGIKLNGKKDLSNSKKIIVFDEPKIIKIQLKQEKYKYIPFVKIDECVKIGDVVAKDEKFDLPLFSSVSGTVKNIDDTFIEIENDFKNSYSYKEIENKVETKDQFIKLLKEKGLVGLSGSMYPVYKKYDVDFKTLIVNAVECEPYITSDYIVSKNYSKEIIKILQLIIKIYNLDECYIAIKGKNKVLKEKFNTKLATSKNIKIVTVPDIYPMGWSRNLVRYIKHTDYDKHTNEKGIVISNISTIYSIYEAIFLNKPLYERIVTISGEKFKNKGNIKVKFGTELNEILKENKINNIDNTVLVSGGPMMGYKLENNNSIYAGTNSILAIEKHKNIETECIRCGKCIQNCPAKIYPVLIRESINNKNELKKLNCQNCIGCGICSYICPAKINLREYVERAKGELNGRK